MGHWKHKWLSRSHAERGKRVHYQEVILCTLQDPYQLIYFSVSVCLYIAYIACGSASLYIKTLYFFLTVLVLLATATVANIKIRYDAKIPQFAIFGTRVIYVFYSISILRLDSQGKGRNRGKGSIYKKRRRPSYKEVTFTFGTFVKW